MEGALGYPGVKACAQRINPQVRTMPFERGSNHRSDSIWAMGSNLTLILLLHRLLFLVETRVDNQHGQ